MVRTESAYPSACELHVPEGLRAGLGKVNNSGPKADPLTGDHVLSAVPRWLLATIPNLKSYGARGRLWIHPVNPV